ncbi:MAG: hypothetical protein ABI601_09775 [bacterium]
MPTASRLLRSVSLLLALLSAVVLGNAREVACVKHGLGAMPAHSAAGHHASHGATRRAEPASGHQHGESEGQDCCCIDDCSTVVTIASAAVTPTLLVAYVSAQPRRVFDDSSAPIAPSEADRLLPFANGPPAERLI